MMASPNLNRDIDLNAIKMIVGQGVHKKYRKAKLDIILSHAHKALKTIKSARSRHALVEIIHAIQTKSSGKAASIVPVLIEIAIDGNTSTSNTSTAPPEHKPNTTTY